MKKLKQRKPPLKPAKQPRLLKGRKPEKAVIRRRRKRETITADKYTYRIEWNSKGENYSGTCLEFQAFSVTGSTPEEALKTIMADIAALLKKMLAAGTIPPEPLGLRNFKGNLTLRVPSELHHDLVVKAAEEGVSLNQLILSKL